MDINWLALVLAALVRFFLGWAWYSPIGFGKAWQALTGVTPETMKSNMAKAIPADLVLSLLMAYVLARVFASMQPTSLLMALAMAMTCWAGFVVSVTLSQTLYEQRPIKLFVINAVYMGVSMCGMAAVLFLMH
jgi:hypothetical protein